MTEDTKTRKPRLKRGDPDSHELTTRDLGIIKAVYTYRMLTTAQVERLFFPPTKENRKYPAQLCLRRLRYLFDKGYLERTMQPIRIPEGTKPLIYRSTKTGLALLKEHTGEEYPSRRSEEGSLLTHPDHWIKTNDLRITIEYWASQRGYEVEWVDEIELRKLHKKHKVVVVPDGFFKLTVPPSPQYEKQRVFRAFVETVLTQTVASYGRKVEEYNYFFNSRYEDLYQSKSVRVLAITTSNTKALNLKTTTEAMGGRSRFWFTTVEKSENNNILDDFIWSMAASERHHAFTEIAQ